MLTIQNDNITYKLGRNAKENFELIDNAKDINPEYLWFHLDNHPSGHCIIYSKDVTDHMIKFAARLVKQYSKLKADKKVKIIYAQIKYVKKTNIIGKVLLQGPSNNISV